MRIETKIEKYRKQWQALKDHYGAVENEPFHLWTGVRDKRVTTIIYFIGEHFETHKIQPGYWKFPEFSEIEDKIRELKNQPKPSKKQEVTEDIEEKPEVENVEENQEPELVEVTEVIEEKPEISEYVPRMHNDFVPFGNYYDIEKVIKSKMFFPVFVTGLSGNGKTFSIEQAAARNNRELFRINITIETDEYDLIGGFRLQDGNTVWHDGPVITAMKRGAILLLDEIDLASDMIMILQPVLECKGIFIKKINQHVYPSEGFTIFATANTKGKGDDSGNFIGTNILNEAFLDRFPLTLEQTYPDIRTELNIVNKTVPNVDQEFVKNVLNWTHYIRDTYNDSNLDETISTRRLVNIIKTYKIFEDETTAIRYNINRFDDVTKESLLDFYNKVKGGDYEKKLN